MKPRSPKKRDVKPNCKTGEVKEKDNSFYNLSLMLGGIPCSLDLSIEKTRNVGFTRTIFVKGNKNINNLFD